MTRLKLFSRLVWTGKAALRSCFQKQHLNIAILEVNTEVLTVAGEKLSHVSLTPGASSAGKADKIFFYENLFCAKDNFATVARLQFCNDRTLLINKFDNNL